MWKLLLLPLLALIFFLLAIARGVVTNLVFSQSSFGGFSFTFAHGTRLVCLVRQVMEWTHLRVCSAITDGMMDPSAVAMTALRAVVLVTSRTAFGHDWNLTGVGWWWKGDVRESFDVDVSCSEFSNEFGYEKQDAISGYKYHLSKRHKYDTQRQLMKDMMDCQEVFTLPTKITGTLLRSKT